MAKIVIALGGNALGLSPSGQKQNIRKAVSHIVDIISDGNEVTLVHGNGPQVGLINKALEVNDSGESFPLAESTAMSQGYIGYQLAEEMNNTLMDKGIDRKCMCLMTRIAVDPDDPAFMTPTKPIGKFYSDNEAEAVRKTEPGICLRMIPERGWRRVVASPDPLRILEEEEIKILSDEGYIVICSGGGGIPVISRNGRYESAEAVIDKDLAAVKTAEVVNADILMILTEVEKVFLGFGSPDQKALDRISIEEALKYCEQGEFGEGSMLPKIKAGIQFASEGREVLITSLECASDALKGLNGTRIVG